MTFRLEFLICWFAFLVQSHAAKFVCPLAFVSCCCSLLKLRFVVNYLYFMCFVCVILLLKKWHSQITDNDDLQTVFHYQPFFFFFLKSIYFAFYINLASLWKEICLIKSIFHQNVINPVK